MSIQTYRLNSFIEGLNFDITSIENEIRQYCIMNNLEIVHLYSEKSGCFRKTCYFHIIGSNYDKIEAIKTAIEILAIVD